VNPYGTLRLYGEPPESPDGAALAWMGRALCAEVGGDFWFPEKGGSTREAKQVCRTCEVRAQCLDYALEHGILCGIWGGTSELERRRLRRQAA